MKTITVILLLLALALGTALIVQQKRAAQRLDETRAEARRFSNEWRQARTKLDEHDRVMTTMETNLTRLKEELTATTTQLAQTKADLAQSKSDLSKVHADLRVAQGELEKKNSLVTELEGEKDNLAKKMNELTNSIQVLEIKIADTQRKLATAEGNRDFLLTELKRLQDEKAMLAAQFSNLAALRAQIARLKEEAAIAQRLSWMEKGIYQRREMKGAEVLIAPTVIETRAAANRLNVEVENTGGARVLPATNSPPTVR